MTEFFTHVWAVLEYELFSVGETPVTLFSFCLLVLFNVGVWILLALLFCRRRRACERRKGRMVSGG